MITVRVLSNKGHLKNVSLDFAPKSNRIANVEAYTSAPFLPIPCYAVGFHFFFIFETVLPINSVGFSISLIAKSIASIINAFTLGFL